MIYYISRRNIHTIIRQSQISKVPIYLISEIKLSTSYNLKSDNQGVNILGEKRLFNETSQVLQKKYTTKKMPQSGVGSMQGSIEGRRPLKFVFNLRSSSTTGHLPSKVATKGHLPLKVVFHPSVVFR